jgi:sugar-specific transcriptional regulator TrmB
MILDLFKKLNFSDKEIEVYLSILKNGKISPNDLSKLTKINRTTVYSVVNELIKKGIVTQDFSQSRTYINALPPEDLTIIIKKEEKELEKKKGIVSDLVRELKNITSNVKYSIPKIRFIGEEEFEDYLYKQTPKWNESMLKTEPLLIGFQDHTFVESYQKWIDWYWTQDTSARIKLQLLTNESKIEKRIEKFNYKSRLIKFYKKGYNFSASTWVLGDYLVLLVTNQRPHYAIEILNPVLAENQREVFKGLWDGIK